MGRIMFNLVELSNLLKCSQAYLNHIAHGKRNWNKSKFFKTTDTLSIIKI